MGQQGINQDWRGSSARINLLLYSFCSARYLVNQTTCRLGSGFFFFLFFFFPVISRANVLPEMCSVRLKLRQMIPVYHNEGLCLFLS